MGLARPAELHGYPGPAHVLDAARQRNRRSIAVAIEVAVTGVLA